MRDQYAGDISDLIKFALLRNLAGSNRRLGIAWYYSTGNDDGPDGRHLEWRDDQHWTTLDPELAKGLAVLPERSIAALQSLEVYPRETLFHSDPIPALPRREAWLVAKRSALRSANLVFLDPDNGLGSASQKHATVDEVVALREQGRMVCFITFPGRRPHDLLVAELHESLRRKGVSGIATMRTSVSLRGNNSSAFTPRQRWFTVIDADGEAIERLDSFSQRLAGMPRTIARVDVTL